MKQLLILLCSIALLFLIGCTNQDKDNALKDPITLNLVKQSVHDDVYQTYAPVDYVHNYYNSCSLLSRLVTSCVLFIHPQAPGTYKSISCDALDLRLKNLKINIDAAALVAYYMNKQQEENDKAELVAEKQKQVQHQQLIESMANGKS